MISWSYCKCLALKTVWINCFDCCYSYFQDGLKTIEHFGSYIQDLAQGLQKIRQKQDEERKQLTDLRNLLKSSPVFDKEVSFTILDYQMCVILLRWWLLCDNNGHNCCCSYRCLGRRGETLEGFSKCWRRFLEIRRCWDVGFDISGFLVGFSGFFRIFLWFLDVIEDSLSLDSILFDILDSIDIFVYVFKTEWLFMTDFSTRITNRKILAIYKVINSNDVVGRWKPFGRDWRNQRRIRSDSRSCRCWRRWRRRPWRRRRRKWWRWPNDFDLVHSSISHRSF